MFNNLTQLWRENGVGGTEYKEPWKSENLGPTPSFANEGLQQPQQVI